MEAVIITIITGVFGLITAFGVEIIRRQSKHLSEVREASKAALNQVQNNHKSNLRDDVDELLDGLGAVLRGQDRHDLMLRRQAADLGRLRRELRDERRERIALAVRVDELVTARSR